MNYLDLYQTEELHQRVRKAYQRLESCDLCPHDCGVNRLKSETGICGGALLPKVASANIHRGEEPPISGTHGSGTIFLSGCPLACSFCQNFPISQLRNGDEMSTKALAGRMLQLQKRRAHNINFVSPTHFMPQILAALWLAIPEGFNLPLVWNTGGYEKVDALELLDGVVDIYLPDMKYSEEGPSVDISAAPGYPRYNQAALIEMHRQVGHLRLDDDGIAIKGLIVRHLVLPGELAGSRTTLRWISDNLGSETHIALMSQYFPAHAASKSPGLNRTVNYGEYDRVLEDLEEFGLENGWIQELDQQRGEI